MLNTPLTILEVANWGGGVFGLFVIKNLFFFFQSSDFYVEMTKFWPLNSGRVFNNW